MPPSHKHTTKPGSAVAGSKDGECLPGNTDPALA